MPKRPCLQMILIFSLVFYLTLGSLIGPVGAFMKAWKSIKPNSKKTKAPPTASIDASAHSSPEASVIEYDTSSSHIKDEWNRLYGRQSPSPATEAKDEWALNHYDQFAMRNDRQTDYNRSGRESEEESSTDETNSSSDDDDEAYPTNYIPPVQLRYPLPGYVGLISSSFPRDAQPNVRLKIPGFISTDGYITGDGNCQFRAISYLIYGDKNDHLRVRNEIVEELIRSGLHLDTVDDPEAYISDMSCDEHWGDAITLASAANLFRTQIIVLSLDSQPYFCIYGEQFQVSTRGALVFREQHYELLFRKVS